MLSDDAAVDAVMFDREGVLAGIRPGATIVELSSVYPATSRKIAAAAAQRGVAVLGVPVSGSTPQAEAGALIFPFGVSDLASSIGQVFKPAQLRAVQFWVGVGNNDLNAAMSRVSLTRTTATIAWTGRRPLSRR